MNKKHKEFWIDSHKIIVDEKFMPIIERYSWHVVKNKQTYYVYTNVVIGDKQISLSMHRFITGMRKTWVDHRNRNGLDNRLTNLRYADPKTNSFNRHRPNKLGYRGIYQPKGSSNYSFQIQKEGVKYREHGFKTPEEAARAYDKKNKEWHGEFGLRNFKD